MRYNNSDILTSPDGFLYYKAKRYPFIPPSESDIYLITAVGDRLDLIANTYYKDATLWWIIASVNALGSMFPEPGIQIRVPTDLNTVLTLFDKENKL